MKQGARKWEMVELNRENGNHLRKETWKTKNKIGRDQHMYEGKELLEDGN